MCNQPNSRNRDPIRSMDWIKNRTTQNLEVDDRRSDVLCSECEREQTGPLFQLRALPRRNQMHLVLMRIGFRQQCHGGNNEESSENYQQPSGLLRLLGAPEEDAPLCCGKELPKCKQGPGKGGKSPLKLEEQKPCELPLILSSSLV